MTNRILISSNTISYIINNFLISTNREKTSLRSEYSGRRMETPFSMLDISSLPPPNLGALAIV